MDAPRRPTWTPADWRNFAAAQQPQYADALALAAVEARLAEAPPVAAIAASRDLRARLADLATGHGFVLQGGDCAESFDDPVAEAVDSLAHLFDAMAARIAPAANGPLVEIARIAGQFAKPRTDDVERMGDAALPSYRGDIINGQAFAADARAADPQRMLRAHLQSVGAAASLAAARPIDRPIYTSHEGLLLPYEQALARRDDVGRWWATSGHMLWLGDRTRDPDGAHAAFLAGIDNVVGVKCGPSLGPDTLRRLLDRLDPECRPGKILLIGRFGADQIGRCLPPLMRAAQRSGHALGWMIDPMHGNTRREGQRKVRRMEHILAETRTFFAIARSEKVHPAGIHLEMSGRDVTECLGGQGPATVREMGRNYRSACDPRLNRAQAIDLAGEIAALVAGR